MEDVFCDRVSSDDFMLWLFPLFYFLKIWPQRPGPPACYETLMPPKLNLLVITVAAVASQKNAISDG